MTMKTALFMISLPSIAICCGIFAVAEPKHIDTKDQKPRLIEVCKDGRLIGFNDGDKPCLGPDMNQSIKTVFDQFDQMKQELAAAQLDNELKTKELLRLRGQIK